MEVQPRKRERYFDDPIPEPDSSKRAAAAAVVEYRLLCPAPRIGTIIGKGGAVIQQLREDTGARIKVEPEIPACTERLIILSSAADPHLEWCQAQDALFSVHSRLADDEAGEDALSVVRMLIDLQQVGCILGKGGEVINTLRKETGAQIRVIDKRDLPPCAGKDDALIIVKADREAAVDALKQLSALLRTHSQRRPQQRPLSFNITAVASSTLQQGQRPPHLPPVSRPPQPLGNHCDLLPPYCTAEVQGVVQVQHRVLVPATHIGCVIGRRGETIQSIREDTGAHVKIHEGCSEKKGMDRVITVSSADPADSHRSPAQEALCLICMCLLGPSGMAPVPSIRTLIPTLQVGALLGKGGATITQVRKESGATVRLLPLEAEDERLLPREIASVASHKLLQFEGPITAILKALRTVCRLLRGCQAKHQGVTMRGHAADLPCGLMSGDSMDGLQHRRPLERFGRNPDSGSGSASPVPMNVDLYEPHHPSRDMGRNGYSAPRALVERPVGLIRQHQQQQDQRQPPAAGDQPSAKELQLVGVQVGCVLGKAGENITQIRKISGARVKLSDAPRGVTERTLRLSGHPEQVQAAVNLVQAFLLAGGAGGL